VQYHDKEVDYIDNNWPVLTSSPLKRRHMDWDDWLEDTLSDDEEVVQSMNQLARAWNSR